LVQPISLPFRIFEPKSRISLISDYWCFAHLFLTKSAQSADPIARMKLVITLDCTFPLSNLSLLTLIRWNAPSWVWWWISYLCWAYLPSSNNKHFLFKSQRRFVLLKRVFWLRYCNGKFRLNIKSVPKRTCDCKL